MTSCNVNILIVSNLIKEGLNMSNKATAFLSYLEHELSTLSHNDIKEEIGDSINNNRIVTVNQVIRYFCVVENYELAGNVKAVYSLPVVKNKLNNNRHKYNNRTDGFDINELLFTLENLTKSSNTHTRELGKALVA